jgi:hypothetical protein
VIKQLRQAVFIVFLTNICLLLARTTSAYIICPELILEKMIQTVGWPSGYAVTQKVSLDYSACEAADDQASLFEETAWFKSSGKFRSRILVNNIKREYVFDNDGALTIIDGHIISTTENPLMVYKDLFIFRGRERLAERLSALGIDMTVVSLGRLGDTVAFVIGAQYPDESVSQLWVDKETFLPLRLILKDVGSDVAVEVRYLDWQRQYRFRHPYRIEIYQNDRISRVVCVKNIQDGCREPDSFFDVATLKLQYPGIDADGGSVPQQKNQPGGIQETIDDFKKLYQ